MHTMVLNLSYVQSASDADLHTCLTAPLSQSDCFPTVLDSTSAHEVSTDWSMKVSSAWILHDSLQPAKQILYFSSTANLQKYGISNLSNMRSAIKGFWVLAKNSRGKEKGYDLPFSKWWISHKRPCNSPTCSTKARKKEVLSVKSSLEISQWDSCGFSIFSKNQNDILPKIAASQYFLSMKVTSYPERQIYRGQNFLNLFMRMDNSLQSVRSIPFKIKIWLWAEQ